MQRKALAPAGGLPGPITRFTLAPAAASRASPLELLGTCPGQGRCRHTASGSSTSHADLEGSGEQETGAITGRVKREKQSEIF